MENRARPVPGLAGALRALPARGGVLLAIAAVIALAAGALMWSQAPDWRVLYANVSDRDGGAVIQALGQMNVPYKFADGGTAIMVPADRVYEARLRLASQGLPRGGAVGFELLENQRFGTTQFQEQVNYQRALEGELARSIQSLAAVHSARVHLALPKQSAFLREGNQPSASVLVNLHAGRTLDRAQVQGIVHLVSSSVPALAPKSVSVVDQSGALLSGTGDAKAGGQLDAAQLGYVAQLEAGYIKRIVDILEPMVGRNNVRAQVTAELDFSETESTAETYTPNQDPKTAAVRSHQLHESANGGGAPAGGVPGALSNQPAPPATAPITGGAAAPAGQAVAGANNASRRESTTNYEVDKTVRHTRNPVGAVKRLSAAVVVNHRPAADAAAAEAKDGTAAAAQALSAEEMAQVTALVKEAIGFSQARGDSLNVVNVAFTAERSDAVPEPPLWRQPETVAFAKDTGRNLLVAALVLYLFFAVLRPLLRRLAAAPPPAQAAAPELLEATQVPPSAERLQAARQLAKQDPKVVASVVRTWVAGNE